MQTFLVGLLLAGVSATSLVAFKHPFGYARLFPYLLGIATTIFVGVTLWLLGVEMTWRGLEDFLNEASLAEAENEKQRLSVPYLWVVLWYLGSVAFFWVNLRLPSFLQVADESHETAENENSH